MKRTSTSEPSLVSKKVKLISIVKSDDVKSPSKKEVKIKFGKKSSLASKSPNKGSKKNGLKSKGPVPENIESSINSQNLKANDKSPESKKPIKKDSKTKFGKKLGTNKKALLFKKKGNKAEKFQEIPSKLLGKDGKPKWSELKEQKKKLRRERRVKKTGEDQYELSVIVKAKWETLREKELSAEQREALVNELFMLLKGEIPNVVHSHDLGRVVQWMLKLGSASVRTSVCEALSANTADYLQSKYASFCVRRALKYGSKSDRSQLIQSCKGRFLKLLSHSYGSRVVELMYSTFASADQRKQIHREVYGEMQSLLPPEVNSIEQIPNDIKPAILGATKANLTKLLSKEQLLKSTIVQHVLTDFLSSCSPQDSQDLLELMHGDILELINTKEGARAALQTIWHATNKMKKVIVKKLKGRVKEVAMSEFGHILLLALFDSVDDTVLVKKALIPEVLSEVEELAKNEWGRKVILYLVAHRDPLYFHPQQVEILSKGDAISTRKKDVTLRKEELLEMVSAPLLEKIAADPAFWLNDSSLAMVALAIVKSGKGEPLKRVFEKVAAYVLDSSSVVEINNRSFHAIELSALHLVLKKLLQLDQAHPDRGTEPFSMVVASQLTDENMKHILQFNRGCFLLVLVFESNNEEVCEVIKSKFSKKITSFLQKQETTGAKILLKKLKSEK